MSIVVYKEHTTLATRKTNEGKGKMYYVYKPYIRY